MENEITSIFLSEKENFYRLAFSYVKNQQDALDIIQDSVYKALKNKNSVKDSKFIRSWFYRIIINTSLTFLKKNKKIVLQDENDFENFSAEDKFQDLDLKDAIDNLPFKYKTVIVLRYFEDMKIEDIAEILDENPNTIKTRIYTALKKLKIKLDENDYKNVEIPNELANIINSKRKSPLFYKIALAAASVFIVFICGVNLNSTFASAAENIPIISSVAKLVTFRQYEDESSTHYVQIDSAKIEGLENSSLVNSLNEKYAEESKALYAEFEKKLKGGDTNIGLSSSYKVKADTERTISIEHLVLKTAASGNEIVSYDTLDKEKDILVTLASLFKDTSYIDIISQNISSQIDERSKSDENQIFFTDDKKFEKIDENQYFYINNDSKLVIVFNKYEIAPGYMSIQEFEIPSEILKDSLVSSEYIN